MRHHGKPSDPPRPGRRAALRCLAWAGGGIVWTVSGGIPAAVELAAGTVAGSSPALAAAPLRFVQISDSHIGFAKDANPDAAATFQETIAAVNAHAGDAALVLHTGDVTHLSRPDQFDAAAQRLKALRPAELHVIPGEHDTLDDGREFFARYGAASGGRGWYSFDHNGVHFIALVNVLGLKAGGQGRLGPDQLAWLADDLAARAASQPLVVFAHMPLWPVYPQWGWSTGDADQAMLLLRRFGSVTVLNGHIHQVAQKVEGDMRFWTARSTAYPQPAPGESEGPGPLRVPADRLRSVLGLRSIEVNLEGGAPAVTDRALAEG